MDASNESVGTALDPSHRSYRLWRGEVTTVVAGKLVFDLEGLWQRSGMDRRMPFEHGLSEGDFEDYPERMAFR
jgi:hypothetical protein